MIIEGFAYGACATIIIIVLFYALKEVLAGDIANRKIDKILKYPYSYVTGTPFEGWVELKINWEIKKALKQQKRK